MKALMNNTVMTHMHAKQTTAYKHIYAKKGATHMLKALLTGSHKSLSV